VNTLNTAFILVDPESEKKLEEIVTDRPEVKTIQKLDGEYPFLIRLESEDLESIKNIVKDIRHSHSIKSTLCLLSQCTKQS